MSLQGKVALITGASKGIGKAIVRRLAADGASVVIGYGGDTASANDLVAEIGKDRAIAVQANVASLADIERLVKTAVDRFGKVDICIPNAGQMLMRDIDNTTEADFDGMFAINVKGPYFLVQNVVPHMPPGSRVILVSTGVCNLSGVQPNYLLYGATKGAIEQMTRIMAKGLAKKGIIVNAIAPGPTGTDLFFEGKSEGLVNGIKALNPFNRLGMPEDLANVVSFLCGKDSAWVVGHVLKVNGGMT